jgi:4a-hydroxytetrahydrobiopterin dehydratase
MTINILAHKKCTPCEGGVEPLTKAEAKKHLEKLDDWSLADDARIITKGFEFENYEETLNFVNRVAEIAEENGHHPDIFFGYGYAEILIHTHKINGLHENDFILAAKIDNIH